MKPQLVVVVRESLQGQLMVVPVAGEGVAAPRPVLTEAELLSFAPTGRVRYLVDDYALRADDRVWRLSARSDAEVLLLPPRAVPQVGEGTVVVPARRAVMVPALRPDLARLVEERKRASLRLKEIEYRVLGLVASESAEYARAVAPSQALNDAHVDFLRRYPTVRRLGYATSQHIQHFFDSREAGDEVDVQEIVRLSAESRVLTTVRSAGEEMVAAVVPKLGAEHELLRGALASEARTIYRIASGELEDASFSTVPALPGGGLLRLVG